MPKLKYNGAAESIQVFGFGHFKPGDEKEVDDMTAAVFSDQRCVDEGFEVIDGAPALAALQQDDRNKPGGDETLSKLGRKEHEQERNQ